MSGIPNQTAATDVSTAPTAPSDTNASATPKQPKLSEEEVAKLLPKEVDVNDPQTLKYHLAMAEKRRRDTQSDWMKQKTTISTLDSQIKALTEQIEKLAVSGIKEMSDAEQRELEELKFSDPDAWRVRMNELEGLQRSKVKAKVKETLDEVGTKARHKSEEEHRKEVFETFMAENPGFELNDDIIANDIPPRITRKLEKGETTFEEFLQECKDFLGAPKTVANPEVLDQPSLGKVPGGAIPTTQAAGASVHQAYKKTVL